MRMISCCLLIVLGCASQQRSIETVLRADAQIEGSLADDIQGGKSLAGSFSRAADSKSAIDLSACPTRFQRAYMRHAQAWESAAQKMEKQSRETLTGFLVGFLGLLADNPGPMLKALYSALTDEGVDMSEVRSTRDAVDESALDFGVDAKEIRKH